MKFYKKWEEVIKFYDTYFKVVKIAAYDAKYGKGLKMLTTNQMLQRLPVVLAQVKVCNTSENLRNKIRQIIYSLFWEKEITKKVCNNIMNLKTS